MDGPLKEMRNKFVFHFDADVAERGLKEMGVSSYKFTVAKGRTLKEVYYALADEVALNYLVSVANEKSGTGSEYSFENLVKETTDLMVRFLSEGEQFIDRILLSMGWELNGNSQ